MALPEPGALTRSGKALVPTGFLFCAVFPPFHTPGTRVQERGKTEGGTARSVLMKFPGCPSGSLGTGRPHGRPRSVGAGMTQHQGGLLPTPPPSGVGDSFERRRTGERGATFSSTNFPPPVIPFPSFKRFMDVIGKCLPWICFLILAPQISSPSPPSTSCGPEGFPTLGKGHFVGFFLTFGEEGGDLMRAEIFGQVS